MEYRYISTNERCRARMRPNYFVLVVLPSQVNEIKRMKNTAPYITKNNFKKNGWSYLIDSKSKLQIRAEFQYAGTYQSVHGVSVTLLSWLY